MNVLLVTYSAYPRIGGRSTYMTILKKSLEEMGHQVDILAHAPGLNQIHIIGKQSIDKVPLRQRLQKKIEEMLHSAYPHLSSWIVLRETERYIFEEAIRKLNLAEYHLIHAQDIFSSMACYRAGVVPPLIATFHNCKVAEWQVNEQAAKKNTGETEYIAREEELSLMRPDKVIVPSYWLQKSFEELHVPSSKFRKISYGLKIDEFHLQMKKPHHLKKPDQPLILCPARLVPIKGHTFLLQALQRVKEEGQRFECWIVGNGVLEENLKKEVKERNLSGEVFFLGGRDDIPAIMSLADMVVLPTLHDTFPFVVMEAQLAGVPIISTTVGGVPEMIEHEETGLIGPPADVEFLYFSICRLLEKPWLRKRMAYRVQQYAETQWSEKRMATETLQVYREVLQNQLNLDHELLSSLESVVERDSLPKEGRIHGQIAWNKKYSNHSVSVHLLDISWISLKSTQCDAQGRFSFEQVPPGKYALMAVQQDRVVSGHVMVREGEEVTWDGKLL